MKIPPKEHHINLEDNRNENLKDKLSTQEVNVKEEENAIEIDRNLLLESNEIFIVRDTILDIIDVKPVYFSDTKAVLKGIPDGTIMLSKSVPGAYAGMAVKPYNSNASE